MHVANLSDDEIRQLSNDIKSSEFYMKLCNNDIRGSLHRAFIDGWLRAKEYEAKQQKQYQLENLDLTES